MSGAETMGDEQFTEEKPVPMPAPIFCDQYSFTIRNGVVTLSGAHGGTFHVALSMRLDLAMLLQSQLAEKIDEARFNIETPKEGSHAQ